MKIVCSLGGLASYKGGADKAFSLEIPSVFILECIFEVQ